MLSYQRTSLYDDRFGKVEFNIRHDWAGGLIARPTLEAQIVLLRRKQEHYYPDVSAEICKG